MSRTRIIGLTSLAMIAFAGVAWGIYSLRGKGAGDPAWVTPSGIRICLR